MRKIIAAALAVTIALGAMTPADASGGCGRGFHRGPRGGCRPNGGVIVAPGGRLVVGNYYGGRGYWDGRRYRHDRYRWHGGWRYR